MSSSTNPYPPNTYHWKLWENIHGGNGGGVAINLSGQSLGQSAIISDGTAILIGGTNITLSQSSNSITFIAGGGGTGGNAFSAGITNSGNTLGTSGSVSGQLLLVGGNNITLSQSRDAFNGSATITISGPNTLAQSVQTQNLVDITLGGNTAGALALISSGTAFLAGGNNVTLSQNGQSVTISAANQSVQPEGTITAGISNLGNTSGTSGIISGTGLQLILAGGNNVTLSQSINGSSATITISGPNTVAQTNQSLGIYASSQTVGQSSSSTYDARSLSLVGQGIVSVGLSGGSLLISATTNQSVQPEGTITAGISNLGNTSGNSGVISGTGIQFILAGGNNITLSQSTNGSSATVTISAFNQTVQTQNLIDVSLSGNTVGVLALISSGTFILAGGNNITLSQNGQSVTISAAQAAGAGTFSAGVSTGGNTVGNTGTVSVQLILAGGNNITLSGSTNGQSATYTISAFNQTVQTQNLIDLSLSGNTAGVLALISSGTGILAGGNNITLSQNGQSVTISGANTVAQTVQTIGLYASSQTVGQSSSSTFDARSISIVGQGIVSVGESAGSFLISATTAAQTAASNTLGISNLGNTSGTSGVISGNQLQLLLAGGNNITLSQSINGASATITISAANAGAGAALTAGLTNIGNTSGDTVTVSQQLILAGGNNITLSGSSNAGSLTITISGPNTVAQSVQTLGIYASSQTVGQSSSSTYDARSLSLVGQGIVSVGWSNNSLLISATTVAQTVESQSIGMSNIGNTSGTTGIASGGQVRFLFAGGNNVTLSQSLNGASGTITVSAFNQTAESNTFGMSNIGNTSGTTGVVSANQVRVLFAGGNNVTLSQSINGVSATITVSAFNQTVESNTLGISNLGNTSGTSGVVSAGQVRVLFAGGNNITLSQSTNGASATITVSGAASVQVPVISHWCNIEPAGSGSTNLASIGTSNATLWLFPLTDPSDIFPGNMTVSSILIDMSGSGSSNTSGAHTYTVSIGFYTLQDASNLALVHSGSTSWNLAANNSNSNSYQGARWISLQSSQFNTSLTFSNTSYWMGIWVRSSSIAYSLSFLGMQWMASDNRSGFMNSASASNKSLPWFPFAGMFSVSFSSAMPGTINRSDMSYAGGGLPQMMPHVVFNNLGGIYG